MIDRKNQIQKQNFSINSLLLAITYIYIVDNNNNQSNRYFDEILYFYEKEIF
jgi:hypothetical protein